MAIQLMEVEVKDGKQFFQEIRELSNSHSYINLPIEVLSLLEESLDCVSRCIWESIYKMGYFQGGEATITLQDLADKLKISRSSLEMKIKAMIEAGFLIKQHNYNSAKQQYMASTYFVRLPEGALEAMASKPSRRECFNEAGKFLTEGMNKPNQIQAPIQALETQAKKNEIQAKIDVLSSSTSLTGKAEMLALKGQLKILNEGSEKNFIQSKSTASPTEKGGSPNGWESNNNIQKIDIKNNNNKIHLGAATCEPTLSDKLSTVCSFASQREGRYKTEPVTIPPKIKEKIQKAVRESKSIAKPEEVIAEGEFAVARCFTGKTLDHAANTFCKLLREGRWTTPIPMRLGKQLTGDHNGH